jgi:hypothetical protein
MRRLSDIVKEYMLAEGIPATDMRFLQFYQLALDAARIASQQTGNPEFYMKYAKIHISDSNTFPFPEDMEEWSFVGLCCGGSMVALTYSPDMCPPMLDDCGDMVPVNRPANFGGYVGTDIYDRVVESNPVTRGHFKAFYSGRYFAIDANGLNIDTITLVYKPSLISSAGEYWVFPNDEWLVKDYIAFGRIKNDVSIPVSQKAYHENRFINQKRMARQKNNPIRLQDIFDAIK